MGSAENDVKTSSAVTLRAVQLPNLHEKVLGLANLTALLECEREDVKYMCRRGKQVEVAREEEEREMEEHTASATHTSTRLSCVHVQCDKHSVGGVYVHLQCRVKATWHIAEFNVKRELLVLQHEERILVCAVLFDQVDTRSAQH